MDAAGGGAGSPQLKELRHRLMADPEPEKVLGLIDEVTGIIAAKKERQAAMKKHAELRATLASAEDEKAAARAKEHAVEQMWKTVVGACACVGAVTAAAAPARECARVVSSRGAHLPAPACARRGQLRGPGGA